MKKRRHICRHFLLLWTELEHFLINQSLKNIFKDITALNGVSQHRMIQAVVGIVGLADLLGTSSFRELQSVALVE